MKVITSEKEFQILSIVRVDRTGREVADEYYRQVGEAIAHGTLYVTLTRLREAGLVKVSDRSKEDRRVRNFRITKKGAAALAVARDHYLSLSVFGMRRA